MCRRGLARDNPHQRARYLLFSSILIAATKIVIQQMMFLVTVIIYITRLKKLKSNQMSLKLIEYNTVNA